MEPPVTYCFQSRQTDAEKKPLLQMKVIIHIVAVYQNVFLLAQYEYQLKWRRNSEYLHSEWQPICTSDNSLCRFWFQIIITTKLECNTYNSGRGEKLTCHMYTKWRHLPTDRFVLSTVESLQTFPVHLQERCHRKDETPQSWRSSLRELPSAWRSTPKCLLT